ncbi:MAG: hypothetical protein WA979_08695 [Pacificimonas sp.]
MRFPTICAALLVGASGCAVTPANDGPTEDAIALAAELETRVAGKSERCISTFGTRSLVAIDERTLTYRSGRTLYVNRLEERCPGLEPDDTLITRRFGGRLCALDTIEPRDWGLDDLPGPRCPLGEFTPYQEAE